MTSYQDLITYLGENPTLWQAPLGAAIAAGFSTLHTYCDGHTKLKNALKIAAAFMGPLNVPHMRDLLADARALWARPKDKAPAQDLAAMVAQAVDAALKARAADAVTNVVYVKSEPPPLPAAETPKAEPPPTPGIGVVKNDGAPPWQSPALK